MTSHFCTVGSGLVVIKRLLSLSVPLHLTADVETHLRLWRGGTQQHMHTLMGGGLVLWMQFAPHRMQVALQGSAS